MTDPWEWFICLHEWLIFMVPVGKYTSPMDPMGMFEHVWTKDHVFHMFFCWAKLVKYLHRPANMPECIRIFLPWKVKHGPTFSQGGHVLVKRNIPYKWGYNSYK